MHWLPLLQGEQIADLLGLAAPSLHASLLYTTAVATGQRQRQWQGSCTNQLPTGTVL